nr:hypothetical protein [Tanacetum cinerariifolium]
MLEIDANSEFMVTYNSDNDIVEVCNDLEVNEFMEFVVKSSRIVTLCIVESSLNGTQLSNSGSNRQSNFIHATLSVNVHQTEYHATQINQKEILVFPGSGGFYQNVLSSQQMHGISGNPMYVPCDSVVVGSEDESSESDEDAKTTSAMNKNFKEDKFWNMPPLLKTYVLDIKKKEKLLNRDFKLDTQDRTLKGGKEIMTDMDARFKIDISYSQVWRAKCYALQLLRGTPEESFAEIPLYCHNLKLKNKGLLHI